MFEILRTSAVFTDNLQHGSALRGLIKSLISPGGEMVIPAAPEYPGEFASAFSVVLLAEGDSAVKYFSNLPKHIQYSIYALLIEGGMQNMEYFSDGEFFVVPDIKDMSRRTVRDWT